MRSEAPILGERTTQIRSGVYCDNTKSHVQALPLGDRRTIVIDSQHKPINPQLLVNEAREHLRVSPACSKDSISLVGDKNGITIPMPIRHLI